MRVLTVMIFLCFAWSVNAKQLPGNLVEDMVQFDQAFIPVLYHVKHGKMGEAKKAAFQMRFKWMKLKSRQQDLVNDPNWQDAFCRADDWLDDAVKLIHENESHLAFIQLNQARYEMVELRRQFKIEYYLDYIFQFQEQVQTLAEVLRDEKLYLLEWTDLEVMIGKMNATWIIMRRQQFDPTDFELKLKARNAMTGLQVDIAKALLQFNDIVPEAHQLKMRVAIGQLEEKADQLLQLFGDFEGQPSYYATL